MMIFLTEDFINLIVILGTDITKYQNMLLLPGELGHYWSIAQRLACTYSNQWSLGDLELIFNRPGVAGAVQ